MFWGSQIFLFAFVNFVSATPTEVSETTNAVPPEKVRLLAKYVMKPFRSELEAMEVAKNLAENLMADKNIVKNAPRGFEAVKIDQNDRTEVAEVLGKMVKCASFEKKSRRRLRRDDESGAKGFTMIMLKKTGEFFQLTIHVFAVFIALIIGNVSGLALAVFCTLVGLAQSCAKMCCGCATKFTPDEGCVNGFIAGFGTIGYAALWLIEIPFTLNNPISNHADLRETLRDALDDIIDL